MECKSCTYFDKMTDTMQKGVVLVGFCKLRKKFVSDRTVSQKFCKDKATIVQTQ